MKRRIAAAGILLLAVLLLTTLRAPREPSHSGRTLSQWLASRSATNISGHAEARDAVLAIGAKGVPALLRMIEAKDSRLKLAGQRFLLQCRILKSEPRTAGHLQADALFGFEVLGSTASNAVPALIRIFTNTDPRYTLRSLAVEALGHIGHPSAPALPLLLREFPSTSSLARYEAVRAVAKILSEPGVVVPELAKMLADPEEGVRWTAAEGLGSFKKHALPAVPGLLAAFERASGGDPAEQRIIDKALWEIAPERIPLVRALPLPAKIPSGKILFLSVGDHFTPLILNRPFGVPHEDAPAQPGDLIQLHYGFRPREVLADFQLQGCPEPAEITVTFGFSGGNLFLWARQAGRPVELKLKAPMSGSSF